MTAAVEPKADWPLIDRVRVLDLKSGDVVVIELTDDRMEREDIEQLEDYLHRSIRMESGAVPVLLMPGQTLAGVIRCEK